MNLMKLTFCKGVISKTEIFGFRFTLAVWLFLLNPAQHVTVLAQEETAPGKYRIELKDKDNSPFSLEKPEEFLSVRAIQRRRMQQIPFDSKDLPVNPAYIDGILSTGARILTLSKWFNAVTVENVDSAILCEIMELPFVRPVPLKKISSFIPTQTKPSIASYTKEASIDYGNSCRQIEMHNGELLHASGYTGKGIHIAVIDAGFNDADEQDAFTKLWQEERILGYRDFVNPSSSFFQGHTHGTTVLSVIGGFIPGYLAGTAPDASFWLLRSEDGNTEYIIEEDNWIAAAEFADSAGVDVINTSLGYSIFDDPMQNHSYHDMDGNSTRISKGADIAASRGMLVVVSAGNEGNSSWRYISAPSDADSVLAVGAVDSIRVIAPFSSRGPSSDGQIKPDVCAMGVRNFGVNAAGTLARSNGTSFSAPVIAGLAACLWQANPDAGVMDILTVIKESADRYKKPDTLYGYGIPDFNLANILLKRRTKQLDPANPTIAFPNPFSSEIYVWFNTDDVSDITVTLYDLSGKIVYTAQRKIPEDEEYLRLCDGLTFLSRGIYLMKVVSNNWQQTTRLLKF
jgi:serine protease AprX